MSLRCDDAGCDPIEAPRCSQPQTPWPEHKSHVLEAKARADPSHALGCRQHGLSLGSEQRGEEDWPSPPTHPGDKAEGAPLQPSLGILLKPS